MFALDRILANPAELIASIEVHDSQLARAASDHLPIKARVDLQAALPHRAAEHAKLAA
jgi:endonuclease/exonuclease/phosphatase family metal-dependent hydrolase